MEEVDWRLERLPNENLDIRVNTTFSEHSLNVCLQRRCLCCIVGNARDGDLAMTPSIGESEEMGQQ